MIDFTRHALLAREALAIGPARTVCAHGLLARGLPQSLSPFTKCQQYRPCSVAFLGQHIFESGRMLLVEPPLNQAMLLKCFQTCRECVGGASSQRFAKVLKPARRIREQIPKNKYGPALSDHGERVHDWAETGI